MIDEKGLEAGQRAAMESNGCGCSWAGEHVFCDDPRLPEPDTVCQCKKDARAAITAYLSASAEPVATNPDVMFGRETVTRLAKQLGVEDRPTTVFKAALAMARETRDGARVLPPLDQEPPMSDIT